MSDQQARIAAVRQFSRFYTRVIGVLQEGLLQSRFSLAEARVLYELDRRPGMTATELGRELGLDPGYLSRILQRFEHDGLLERVHSTSDRRQSQLSLTQAGRDAFAPLDARSCAEVATLLSALSEPAQAALVAAMERIATLLGARQDMPWLLRQPMALAVHCVTTHTAGSLPPGALALIRSPPAMTPTRNCQPSSSPETVQPPGTAFHRRPAIQASSPPTPGQLWSRTRASASVIAPSGSPWPQRTG